MPFASGKSGKLTRKVSPADTSLYLNTDLGITSGRLYAINDTQVEFLSFSGKTTISATEFQYTGLVRQLSTTAVPATSGGTGLTWLANQTFIHDMMHDQIFDPQNGGTIAGATTFSNDVTFTKSIKAPVYANAAARDVAITVPTNGMEVYLTTEGYFTDYVGGVWVARASGAVANASTTVAGKVEIATDIELALGTNTGGTGAFLTPTLKSLMYSFGDGSDGTVIISSNTTLTRDMYYQDLTVNTAVILNPAGFAIYVLGTLTLTGTAKIQRNGNNGNAGSGATGGVATVSLSTGTCGVSGGGSAGGDGGISAGVAGSNGVSPNPSYATTSTVGKNGAVGGTGTGGVGGTGGIGGTATQGILYNIIYSINKLLAMLRSPSRAQSLAIAVTQYLGMPTSGGGGGGGGPGGAQFGGGGGSAGGNGGIIFIYANIIAGTGTIELIGGVGGIGGNAIGNGGGGGGGGCGGNGGILVLIYVTGTVWTLTLTAGIGGVGGTPLAGGTIGGTGQTGTLGQSILIVV